jgi:hypothetical protein
MDSDPLRAKYRDFWIAILSMIIIAGTTLGFWIFLNLLIYRDGLAFGRGYSNVSRALCPLVYFLFVFVILIVQIVRGFKGIRFGVKRFSLHILLIVVSVLFLYLVPKFIEPGYAEFTKGLSKRMKKDVDIPAIQKWLDGVHVEGVGKFEIDESNWPDFIKKFSPSAVFVTKLDDGKNYVRLIWASGFISHWGIVVGEAAVEIPLNDFSVSEYRLELAPNAFVWHEVKRLN